MILVRKLAQRLDPRRQNSHAVLDVSLDVSLVDTRRKVALNQVLDVLSYSELRGTLHFINLNYYFYFIFTFFTFYLSLTIESLETWIVKSK